MKKLNKSALLLAVCWSAVLAAGCSGYSADVCYQGVKAAYPGADIAVIPGEKYRFIVKQKNGDILYVETMNHTNGDVTQAYTAFRGS